MNESIDRSWIYIVGDVSVRILQRGDQTAGGLHGGDCGGLLRTSVMSIFHLAPAFY